jgi:hypothetical protein
MSETNTTSVEERLAMIERQNEELRESTRAELWEGIGGPCQDRSEARHGGAGGGQEEARPVAREHPFQALR